MTDSVRESSSTLFSSLPPYATVEQAMECLYFMAEVEQGSDRPTPGS